MNPYAHATFFQFFPILWMRLWQLFTGKLSLSALATDEVQLLALAGVAIATSLVGVLLVLRRMTMLANSLSHTTLPGLIVVYLCSASSTTLSDPKLLLGAAFLSALLTALATQFFTRIARLQKDASISLVFTAFFALGVLLVSLYARNTHLDIEAIMGNADALHRDDLMPVGVTLALNLLVITLFFKEWKITSFDASLARTLGISPGLFTLLLLLLTSVTLMGSFRAVGVMLVLAYLVMPPLAARRLTHRLGPLFLIASILSVTCTVPAVALSRHLLTVYCSPLSTSGLVTTLLGLTTFILGLHGRKVDRSKGEGHNPTL